MRARAAERPLAGCGPSLVLCKSIAVVQDAASEVGLFLDHLLRCTIVGSSMWSLQVEGQVEESVRRWSPVLGSARTREDKTSVSHRPCLATRVCQ